MRLAVGCRRLAPVLGFLGAIAIATPGHAIQMIEGNLPFSVLTTGPAPFTAFNGGLTVTTTDDIEFSISYDETTADSNGSGTVGVYNAITQVTFTIGGSMVTVNPGATQADFSTSQSKIEIDTVADQIVVDILSETDLTTFEFQRFTLVLTGPGGLLASDSLDPLGGLASLSLADFTGTNTASLETGPSVPFPGNLRAIQYNVNGGTITFPNSVTSPPTPAIPEPSTLSLLAMGLLGMAWMRRRREPASSGRPGPAR